MIATVQNTSHTVKWKGQDVQVWEGRSQGDARFHLFVAEVRLMPNQTLKADKFQTDLTETKLPAKETAELADELT